MLWNAASITIVWVRSLITWDLEVWDLEVQLLSEVELLELQSYC